MAFRLAGWPPSAQCERPTPTLSLDHLDAVNAALDADDTSLAVRLATEAVADGHEATLLFNLAAYGHEQAGRFIESLDLLTRARAMDPYDPLILNAIGQSLSQQGRNRDSIEAFQGALAIDPRLAPAHHGLGLAFGVAGDGYRARFHLEQAVTLAPAFPDPLGSLSAVAFKAKSYDEARGLAERALVMNPAQTSAVHTLAMLDQHEGRDDHAERRIRELLARGGLAPLHEASVRKLLGDILAGREEWSAAWEAYASANRLTRVTYRSQFDRPDVESGVAYTQRMLSYFRAAPAEPWKRSPLGKPSGPLSSEEPSRHVFLMGMHRSGTTLLEQVLASHPDACALEERRTIEDAAWTFLRDDEGVDRLAEISESEALWRRRDYWRTVRGFGVDPAGKVFVDKMPLSSLWLPYIAKLFPDARILFAIRDPRDVVLSCFRLLFQVNPLMYEYTDIERASLLYDGVLALMEVYGAKMDLTLRYCRNEDLIGDFDSETQAICAHLGISWSPKMRDFVDTASRRDIRTPSASQVARGLNDSGVGQWRVYAEQMQPARAILAPWVRRFGYAVD